MKPALLLLPLAFLVLAPTVLAQGPSNGTVQPPAAPPGQLTPTAHAPPEEASAGASSALVTAGALALAVVIALAALVALAYVGWRTSR